MSNIKTKCLLFLVAFFGCADIPDELREDAKSDGICGFSMYNPSTSFCFEGNVYAKCDGLRYNPTTQICQGIAVTAAMCGGSQYNPLEQRCFNNAVEIKCGTGGYYYNTSTQFCNGNSVYSKCGGREYYPSEQRCQSDVIMTKCGTWGYYYNTETQFCYSNSVYDKCGGKEYNPSDPNQRCQSNVVETQCGGNWYALNSNQRCRSNIIETQCGSDWYNTSNSNLRCMNNVIETKCGSNWYALNSNQRCQSNIIETQCGSDWYNTSNSNQRCQSNVVETKCGGNWYALNSNQRCQSNIIETQCGSDWYNTSNSNQRCQSNVVEIKCDSDWYNSKTQFCQVGTNAIKYLCDKATYTSTQYCSNGTVKTYGTVSDGVRNYKTVVIGTQTWMAENLNYNASGSKCYAEGVSGISADSIAKNCAKYGRLYNWSTAMNGAGSSNTNPSNVRGVCPSSWHLPSNAEWDALMAAVGGSSTAGTKLKATSGWNDYNDGSSGNGTDEFGFSALPGGYGDSSGGFDIVGYYGYWWSSTEYNASYAYRRYMYYYFAPVYSFDIDKANFCSVRCVQD